MTQHKNPCPAGYFNAYGAKARHPCLAVLVSAHDVVGAPPAFAGACFAHHDGIKPASPQLKRLFSTEAVIFGRQYNTRRRYASPAANRPERWPYRPRDLTLVVAPEAATETYAGTLSW
jgi:hypothetical protein